MEFNYEKKYAYAEVDYILKWLGEEYINKVSNDSSYIFNFYSMITMSICHGFKVYKAHNCMSFVSEIIELSEAVNMSKPYYKYNIKEIDEGYRLVIQDFRNVKIARITLDKV